MIEFRVLGRLDLRGSEGEAYLSILAQPKRVALLAYLAVAAPRGFHRRDRLIGLFWPERDSEHARGALRNALYFLRQSLGDGLIAGRGAEEVGLAAEAFRCDAVGFESALEAGEREKALELYRGDLLEGFYVAEAPEFERWLEGERERLRARATEAAWTLAEDQEAAGNGIESAKWARRAVSFSPDDESGFRRLLELLDRVGDRAGAMKEYEAFARRLQDGYEVEPSPETQALIAAIREREKACVEAAVSRVLATEPADRFSTAAEFAEALEPVSRPAGRRVGLARAIGLSAAASVVVFAVAYFLMLPGRTGSTANQLSLPVEETRVAVFPFAFRGGEEFEYLGEGVASLLATALDGAGDLRVVDNRALLSLIAQRHTESLSPEETRTIARQLGAGRFVLGDIVEVEGRLQVNAVFYSPGNGRERASASVEGPADQIFELVNDLAVRLVVGEPGAPGERLTQVASVTTQSPNALKAYLQGEAHFHAGGRTAEAARAFERAVALDSTFALAWYRLSVVGDFTPVYPSPQRAAEKAVQHASRLSERDNQMLQAYLAWVRGDGREAERRYTSIVSAYPTAVHVWEQLGEVRFHYGPMVGRSLTRSHGAWQRVLVFEPDHRGALMHLARIAALEGNLADLDSLVGRAEHLKSEGRWLLEVFALRAFAIGDSAAQAEVADHLYDYARKMVALYAADLSGARTLANMGARLAESVEQRALYQLRGAGLALAHGRWQEARSALDSAGSLDPALALEYRALFSLSPFLDLPRSELERLDSELAAWDAGAVLSNVAGHYGIHEHLKLYLRGVLSGRLGHFAIAEEYAAALESMPGPEETGSLHADLARSVRAQAAWAQGRGEESLELLEQSERVWNYNRSHTSPFFSQALERYLQAELLAQLGRAKEALEWYESIAQLHVTDLIYLAPSHFGRAEIHERLGERDQAVHHYSRFIELWKDADPELQPRVDAARRAIEALSPDR
jgi:serine/threonine-protein kinase